MNALGREFFRQAAILVLELRIEFKVLELVLRGQFLDLFVESLNLWIQVYPLLAQREHRVNIDFGLWEFAVNFGKNRVVGGQQGGERLLFVKLVHHRRLNSVIDADLDENSRRLDLQNRSVQAVNQADKLTAADHVPANAAVDHALGGIKEVHRERFGDRVADDDGRA